MKSTVTVKDGKLCVEQNGKEMLYTAAQIDQMIATLKNELEKWEGRRAMLNGEVQDGTRRG